MKKQNVQLAQQYEVMGFPTIVVLDSNGQKLWQFDGYFHGGPEAFIAQLQKLPKSSPHLIQICLGSIRVRANSRGCSQDISRIVLLICSQLSFSPRHKECFAL